MQVRVLQMLILHAGRTSAATVFIRPMRTIQILRIGKGQLQFADAGYTGEKLRVRHSPFTHSQAQLTLGLVLSYDIPEKHYLPNSFRSAATISAYSASLR